MQHKVSRPLRISLCLFIYFLVVDHQPTVAGEDDFESFGLLMPNVVPEKKDTYYCTTVRMDSDIDYYITGFVPNNTEHSLRQILLYGCEEPGSIEDLWDCGGMIAKKPKLNGAHPCRKGPQLLYAWSLNAPEFNLPKGVGFHVGGRSPVRYITMQVQYASVKRFTGGATDNSGVILQYTEKPQPKAAGVILLGTGGQVRARTVEHFETACKVHENKVIHPLAYSTHTHGLGRVVSGYKVTKHANIKIPDEWELIGKQDPQMPQSYYPVVNTNITLTKGDILAARCTMVSNRDRTTRVGMSINDEMCNFYLMYWTEGTDSLRIKNCFTPGAPSFYWRSANRLNNIPEDASSL